MLWSLSGYMAREHYRYVLRYGVWEVCIGMFLMVHTSAHLVKSYKHLRENVLDKSRKK